MDEYWSSKDCHSLPVENKENSKLSITAKAPPIQENSMSRTPLQEVNSCSQTIMVHSPVTPVTPSGRTSGCRRSSVLRRKSCSVSSNEVMINTLVYAKVQELMREKIEPHMTKLQDRDDAIAELESKLAAACAGPARQIEQMIESACQTSSLESQLEDVSMQSVNMKQPGSYQNQSVMTSPIHFQFRSHNDEPTREELLSQMEYTIMSNDILRSELSASQREKESLEKNCAFLKTAASDADERVKRAVKQEQDVSAKRLAQVLEQQSQLMMQVASLNRDASERQEAASNVKREYDQEVKGLREEVTRLQQDLSLVYKQKKQQTDLCNEYKACFERSTQRVTYLQDKLNVFTDLKSAVEEVKESQIKATQSIAAAAEEIKISKDKFLADKKDFNAQKSDWLSWKETEENRLQEAIAECSRIIVESSEIMLKNAEFQKQLEESNNKMKQLLEHIAFMEEVQQELESNMTKVCKELETKDQALDETKQKISLDDERTDYHLTEVEVKLKLMCRHDREILNLQRTLDMREHDFDDLFSKHCSLQNLIKLQNSKLANLNLVSSKTADLEIQLKIAQKESREMKDYLEQERKVMNKEVLELRNELTVTKTEWKKLTNELLHHRSILDDLQTELTEKETRIQLQDEDIACAVDELNCIFDQLQSLYGDLTTAKLAQSLEHSKNICRTPAPVSQLAVKKSAAPSSQLAINTVASSLSFVSQVLSAASGNQSKLSASRLSPDPSDNISLVDSSAIAQPNTLSTSHFSAFVAVAGSKSTPSRVPSVLPSLDAGCKTSKDRRVSLPMAFANDHRLSDHVKRVGDLLDQLVCLAVDFQSKFLQMCNTLAAQKQQLSEERTEHLKEMNQCQTKWCEAKSKIDSLQLSEDGARHEVKLITEERDRLLEAFNKSRQETLESSEAMLNFMSQLTEIQLLKDHVARLEQQATLKEKELDILKEQMSVHLVELAKQGDSGKMVEQLVIENTELRNLKEKLILDRVKKQSDWDISSHKLTELHRISVEQLTRAEREIIRLDDKIERIKQALLPHKTMLQFNDEEVDNILEEIGVLSDPRNL